MNDNRSYKHLKWITITYRDNPTPEQARKNMNTFLQWMRRKGMKNYAWGLEVGKQGKKLHYHMIADVDYIPFAEYEEAWGRIRDDYSGNAVKVEALKHDAQAAQYASKTNESLVATVKAAYASKNARENAKESEADMIDYLDKFRLWATSSGLVGKEKYTTKDPGVHISSVIAGRQWESIQTETGITIYRAQLSTTEKQKLVELIEVLNYREQARRDHYEFIRDERQKKQAANRAQMAVPL